MILNNLQKSFLKKLGEGELAKSYVWSGGTALAYLYLQHRLSYDLDFLSLDLVPDRELLINIRRIAKELRITKIEERSRFNRHEFFLKMRKENLRIEFVYYPFPPIKKRGPISEFKMRVDSLEDMATNKTLAVFERSEPKDTFDLYWILQIKQVKFLTLFKWVEKKFGVIIDPVIFASEALKGADRLQEIQPLVLKKRFYQPRKIKQYFLQAPQEYLKKKIK